MITSFDAAVVRWTAGLGAATADALALSRHCSPSRARGALEQARRAGMLTRSRPLGDRPALYAATGGGLRAVHASHLAPCRVTNSNAQHLIACAQAAAVLEHRHPDHRVEGERELRALELESGRALASSRLGPGPDGVPRTHRPDLVLWPRSDAGLPVAVEVELTLKAPRRLTALCRAWARCQLVGGVIYYAPPEVGRALQRAIDRARAQDRILVVALSEVSGPDQNVPSEP